MKTHWTIGKKLIASFLAVAARGSRPAFTHDAGGAACTDRPSNQSGAQDGRASTAAERDFIALNEEKDLARF